MTNEQIEKRIHEMTVAWVCPLTKNPTTPYEINAIKNLEQFGRNVLAEFKRNYRRSTNEGA